VERPGEGGGRIRTRAQPRQPGEHHVHLQLRARGPRTGLGSGQLRQHGRRGAAHHDVGVDGEVAALVVGPVHGDAVGPPVDAGDRGPGDEFGARTAGGGRHRPGDRAHPADRHPPAAGAVADDVVQEAPAGEAVGGVHVGEGADQPVGQRDAAHHVVGEVVGDDVGQRAFPQVVPELRIA
jgi:hypothetical protein